MALLTQKEDTMENLRRFWEGWKRIGQAIGDFVARVVLTIFYFTLLLPFGLGVRLFGDPLTLRSQGSAGWVKRTTKDKELQDGRRLS